MKKIWTNPTIEDLYLNNTSRAVDGDLEPDGLKYSKDNPEDAGWKCSFCS